MTSPAVDLIPIGSTICTGTTIFDQRNVARPIGAACDAGAYEVDFVPSVRRASTPGRPA